MRRTVIPVVTFLVISMTGWALPCGASFPVPLDIGLFRTYACRPIAEPPVIDGRLDDKAWEAAQWTDDFLDIQGLSEPAPRLRTRAKMLWDRDYFYVAAQMGEPHVWAKLTERDAVIYHDNDFEVFIDPDGDNHLYYELEINALGTEWDLLLVKPYRDGGPAINAWDIQGLKTAVHVDGTLNDPNDVDRGWTVELALPWDGMRWMADGRSLPPVEGDVWRVDLSRFERLSYNGITAPQSAGWVWSRHGIYDSHIPECFTYVHFSESAVK